MATKAGLAPRGKQERAPNAHHQKYPNRRFMITATSGYITLADVKQMVVETHHSRCAMPRPTRADARSCCRSSLKKKRPGADVLQ